MATFKEDSRYRGSTVTEVEQEDETLRNYVLLKKPLNVPLTDRDSYIILDKELEYRPDLISQLMYDTPDYGWAIMEINGLRSMLELKFELLIRIPSLEDIIAAIPESNEY